MALTDDDLGSATPEDSMRVVLLVLANAAIELELELGALPGRVRHDLRAMATIAEAAAAGRLAPEQIARIKTFLNFHAMGESRGRG
jgi:hypothetical protein